MAQILDGRELAKLFSIKLKKDIDQRKEKKLAIPHLAIIVIGKDPAIASYVRNKIRKAHEVGIKTSLFSFDSHFRQSALINKIETINQDPSIDGLIVQLPLPSHIDEKKIILALDPKKDVDGFHPLNIGKMIWDIDTFLPATPAGILLLLDHYGIQTRGKSIVVMGRSHIVGRPLSILLSKKDKDATVSLLHSLSEDIMSYTKKADIIITAIGKERFLKASMVKKDVVIIDVGINRVVDSKDASSYKLVGDVDFEDVFQKASYITPVPGGVGPMTCFVLLNNTLKALKQKENLKVE